MYVHAPLPLALALLQDDRVAAEPDNNADVGDNTGTDPRDFGNKFMPYYRYNKIDNGLESHEAVLFGLISLKIGELFGRDQVLA